MRRVGLFGGTFDPVHLGHIQPSLSALVAFRFDLLVFIPAGWPPHKPGEGITSFAHRFAMLALATQRYDRLLVSDLEQGSPGPTYTFDTLQRWRKDNPDDEVHFLMGSDSFAQITTWHRWQELISLAHLVVLHREPVWGEALLEKTPDSWRQRLSSVTADGGVGSPARDSHQIYLLEHDPVVGSATTLREALGRSPESDGQLPPEVLRYIEKHGLYGRTGRGCDEH